MPVIAVAEGGVRETVIDQVNGLLVQHNPASMAAAIDRLRGDPALARQLGVNGRKIAEEKWNLASATGRIEENLLRHARRP